MKLTHNPDKTSLKLLGIPALKLERRFEGIKYNGLCRRIFIKLHEYLKQCKTKILSKREKCKTANFSLMILDNILERDMN